eukprot:jgi/Ulvmu1/10098/UM006_0047.1
MSEYCEIESMHVHLYRQLQLTTKDGARLAAHRRQWRGLNGSLDASFLESMRLLQSVPTVDGPPAGLLADIADVASGKRVFRALNRAASAGGAAWGVWSGRRAVPAGMLTTGSQRGFDGSPGLVHVHEAHERVVGHMKEFQLLPGVLLGALQYACIYGAHVLSGTTPADVLQLCQLADAQERWRRSWEP